MSIAIRQGEEHLAYAPELYPDERPEPELWPAWDDVEDAE